MNHVLPVSGHPIAIHVPVFRTVDYIFCEDLCADKKKLEGPRAVLSLFMATTERRFFLIFSPDSKFRPAARKEQKKGMPSSARWSAVSRARGGLNPAQPVPLT
jgi:hypothetical protein